VTQRTYLTDTARAFWVIGPGRGEIREERLPAYRGPDEVLVRTLFSGISRGTESLVFRGRVPITEFERMRAPFQAGDFPAPVKYGYSAVGIVEQGPPALVGRHVFVFHPHQTKFIVPSDAVHVLPPDVPCGRAVLAANLETAVNGLWDARPHAGDRITVVGGGAVGCLVAWLAGGIRGCSVELVDLDRTRAGIASALGVKFATEAEAARDVDVVVHASGSPAGLAVALSLAGFESTILEMSWYGADAVPVPLGEAFHSRRLTLKSSQVGTIAAAQRSRWDRRRRFGFVLSLLRDAVLDGLISGECPFDQLPTRMPRLAAGADGVLCERVTY
jgi:threonine dehydrogenase-like Zn-dependent dehydrogenase